MYKKNHKTHSFLAKYVKIHNFVKYSENWIFLQCGLHLSPSHHWDLIADWPFWSFWSFLDLAEAIFGRFRNLSPKRILDSRRMRMSRNEIWSGKGIWRAILNLIVIWPDYFPGSTFLIFFFNFAVLRISPGIVWNSWEKLWRIKWVIGKYVELDKMTDSLRQKFIYFRFFEYKNF